MSYTPTEWESTDVVTATRMNALEQAVGDMNMSYTPNTWSDGDILSAEKMNALEQAVASGGGGGSSDFSTAEMTVNDSVGYLMHGAFAEELWGKAGLSTTTGTHYTDDYAEPFSVVMYKGMAVVEFDEEATITATGDATVNGNYVLITGDCTITIS